MKPLFLSFGVALLVIACGGTTPAAGDNAPAPTGPHDNNNLPAGDATHGKALTVQNSCIECHGGDFSGSGFYPNITPDKTTGIGGWTDAQIAAAIRDGMDDDGASLCSLMERFPFSDQDTADVIAYLHGLPPVSHAITTECPGHGPAK